MQLADEPAVVARLCKYLGDQLFVRGKVCVAVAMHLVRGGIAAGQERGPRRGADRALCIRARERDAFRAQAVEERCRDVALAERRDRVPALLVGAIPEDVGTALPRFRLRRRGP